MKTLNTIISKISPGHFLLVQELTTLEADDDIEVYAVKKPVLYKVEGRTIFNDDQAIVVKNATKPDVREEYLNERPGHLMFLVLGHWTASITSGSVEKFTEGAIKQKKIAISDFEKL